MSESKCIIHHVEQGTKEWLQVRAGIPTASEFDAIITPLWKPRTGDGVDTYLAKKLAERWTGYPLVTFSGGAMDQGKLKEEEAIPQYAFINDVEIDRVGFVTTADGKIGCSPDGLIGEDGGIEFKAPEPHTHVGYLMRGTLPKDYAAQVHGAMLVTDRPWWRFVSYCRGFPTFDMLVERDEEIISKMREAIDAFNVRLDEAFEKLTKLDQETPSLKSRPPLDLEMATIL